ncbi:MAG TPA: pre-peptidase C-terminal domain-containing protein [Crinalium sp.]
MPSDRAGNSLKKARSIQSSLTAKSFKDWIGGSDRDDFYKLRLKSRSSFNLALTNLESDANVSILNRSGKLMKQSAQSSNQNETIQQILDAGTYYIRVHSQGAQTSYRLTTSATPVSVSNLTDAAKLRSTLDSSSAPTNSIPPAESSSTPFKIQFDYRFDTNGWFTPERRTALEAAARVWENIIRDDFQNIPKGSILSVVDPQTNLPAQFNSDYEIDDLVIFVGARDIDGAGQTLADCGPTAAWEEGSSLESRYWGSKFQPWTASLSFDRAESWFFDATPDTATDIPTGQHDFISTAIHEIGHALGISASKAYDNLSSNGFFTGANAIAQNGGNPIPLSPNGHIQDGFIASKVGTEAALDPSQTIGTRKLPNNLDISLLADIGYQVIYG